MRTLRFSTLARSVIVGALAGACSRDAGTELSQRAPVESDAVPAPETPSSEPEPDSASATIEDVEPLPLATDPGIGPPLAPDPVSTVTPCAALREDRSRANSLDLARLGLELSTVRLEGTLGAPEATPNGLLAPLEIEKVWVGPSFLEGTRVFVGFGPNESEGFAPGRYLLGFGSTVVNVGASPLPYRLEGGGPSLLQWDKQAIIPIAERDQFADVLSYGINRDAPKVAVVEVTAQDEFKTTLRVVESLAGDLPSVITIIPASADVPVPGVSPARYLVSFLATYGNEIFGYSGQLMDFRPDAAAARAAAEASIRTAQPLLDPSALLGAVAEYKTGWAFHRAPAVLATRVTGMAHECCSGAGGTFFEHEVVQNLREPAGVQRLVLGGHAYFSDEQCGDGALFGLSGMDSAPPLQPSDSFACGAPSAWPQLYSVAPIPNVVARRPDTPEARRQVMAWLASPDPVHLLRSELDATAPAELGNDAVWSQPLSMTEALVMASLKWINVVDVASEGNRSSVTLETNFAYAANVPLPLQRFQLDAECIDPRLQRVGSSWLAPIVVDDEADPATSGQQGTAFIVPGVLLPAEEYVTSTAAKVRYLVGAEYPY